MTEEEWAAVDRRIAAWDQYLAKRAAQGIEAAAAGETTQIGSTEGKSPVGEANAPE